MSKQSRLSILLTAIFVIGLSLTLAVAQQDLPFLGEVNANNINVRSDATVSSKVISTLNKGEKIDVVSGSSDWYKIRLPKRVSLYFKSSLAECIKYQDGVEFDKNTCLQAKVTSSRVNIRISPDESGAIVGVADNNEIVNVKGESKGWYKIEPTQNSFAWVHKKFISQAAINKTIINKNEEQKEDLIPDKNIILKGRLSPYGMVFRRVATHKLITPDQKIFLLKGDKAILNSLNRSVVKVTGKIISPPKAKYPIVEVALIEVAN